MTHLANTLTALVLTGSLVNGLIGLAVAGTIPDKNLEAALRTQVFEKRDKTDELTDDDLKKIFVLKAKGKGIRDLTGLEKCVNLHELDLAKNEIADVTPLKGLTHIQSLDLSDNKIADVAPLGELTGLQFLELSNNQIASVEPLKKLVKLSALYLAGNKVADVAPLGELVKLSSLDLAKNQISNIGPLGSVNRLSTLKLSDNSIEDITAVEKQKQLSMLFLERNKIGDLAPLVRAAKADAEGEKRFAPFLRLYLAGNPLSDGAKKEQLAALKQSGVRIESQ